MEQLVFLYRNIKFYSHHMKKFCVYPGKRQHFLPSSIPFLIPKHKSQGHAMNYVRISRSTAFSVILQNWMWVVFYVKRVKLVKLKNLAKRGT